MMFLDSLNRSWRRESKANGIEKELNEPELQEPIEHMANNILLHGKGSLDGSRASGLVAATTAIEFSTVGSMTSTIVGSTTTNG